MLIYICFQEIFEISHNGEKCVTESVKRFSTREFAVMNCASSSHDSKSQKTIIAVGHNEKTQLYSCQLARELITPQDKGQIISERNFVVFKSPKKQTKLFEGLLSYVLSL